MKQNLKTFLKGIYAGSSIAFGGLILVIVSFLIREITNAYLKIIPSYLFSIGLILVCFFGFNLCTGKAGFLFNDLILNHDKNSFKNNLKDLLIMIIGNIIGAIFVGVIFGLFSKLNNDFFLFINNFSKSKIISLKIDNILIHFLYSIFCGGFVYLAVFGFKKFKNTLLKILSIIFSIGTFVYFGFFHCIANVFYFSMSLKFSYLMIISFLIEILGNFIGAWIINFIILLLIKLKSELFKKK